MNFIRQFYSRSQTKTKIVGKKKMLYKGGGKLKKSVRFLNVLHDKCSKGFREMTPQKCHLAKFIPLKDVHFILG